MAHPTQIRESDIEGSEAVDIIKVPVIEMTQRGGISKCSEPVYIAEQTDRGGFKFNDQQEWKLYQKYSPNGDDEPVIIGKLSGYSLSSCTELCGWSGTIPNKFFNIRSTTHLQSMVTGRGEVTGPARDLLKTCITLRDMDRLGDQNQFVNSPVYVQVVAKKTVDVPVLDNKLLVIAHVVIADCSGYCTLCAFNEGLSTIYNDVDVGDRLLISSCRPQRPRLVHHRGLFSDKMFLNLELKVQYLSVRNHFLYKFTPRKVTEFKMEHDLFENACQMKLPFDIEKVPSSDINQPPIVELTSRYYDLIGVVTFVGRMERFRHRKPIELQCIVDGKPIIREIYRYTMYRWIYLIDKYSKPTPVKIYVNNVTREYQDALIPGTILILTNCQTATCKYTGTHTTTSNFSSIYVNGEIQKYFMTHGSFRDTMGEIIARDSYAQIMSRRDIQLRCGGTHTQQITDPDQFLAFYRKNFNSLLENHPLDTPLCRRESRRIYFEGIILRVLRVTSEYDIDVEYIHHGLHNWEIYDKWHMNYKVIENFNPHPCFKYSSWYAFQRTLPFFNPYILQKPRCRDIVNTITGNFKAFCDPLLMPAGMPANGAMPDLAGLPKYDGPSYLLLEIANSRDKLWYTVMWKNQNISTEQMIGRINSAREKKIICVADVYKTEENVQLEVNMLDFVLSDE